MGKMKQIYVFFVYFINVTWIPTFFSVLPLTASGGVDGDGQGGVFGVLRREDCGDAAGSSASLPR